MGGGEKAENEFQFRQVKSKMPWRGGRGKLWQISSRQMELKGSRGYADLGMTNKSRELKKWKQCRELNERQGNKKSKRMEGSQGMNILTEWDVNEESAKHTKNCWMCQRGINQCVQSSTINSFGNGPVFKERKHSEDSFYNRMWSKLFFFFLRPGWTETCFVTLTIWCWLCVLEGT